MPASCRAGASLCQHLGIVLQADTAMACVRGPALEAGCREMRSGASPSWCSPPLHSTSRWGLSRQWTLPGCGGTSACGQAVNGSKSGGGTLCARLQTPKVCWSLPGGEAPLTCRESGCRHQHKLEACAVFWESFKIWGMPGVQGNHAPYRDAENASGKPCRRAPQEGHGQHLACHLHCPKASCSGRYPNSNAIVLTRHERNKGPSVSLAST